MNYYIIPTKNMMVNVSAKTCTSLEPHISNSYFKNIVKLNSQINTDYVMDQHSIDSEGLETIKKINDVYSFLHEIMPEIIKKEIHKDTLLFFTLIEIFKTFDFLLTNECVEKYSEIIYVGKHKSAVEQGINYIIKKPMTTHEMNINTIFSNVKLGKYLQYYQHVSFFWFDCETVNCDVLYNNDVLTTLLKILFILIMTKKSAIIKLGNIIHKSSIDIIYILSGIYDTVYMSKPSVVDDINDRYLICKDPYEYHTRGDSDSTDVNEINQRYATSIDEIIHTLENKSDCIYSIVNDDISYHFLSKMEELTLIIGQKFIEYYESSIILMKIYGKEEKVENAKKASLLKCIQWCEKYSIQHTMKYDISDFS